MKDKTSEERITDALEALAAPMTEPIDLDMLRLDENSDLVNALADELRASRRVVEAVKADRLAQHTLEYHNPFGKDKYQLAIAAALAAYEKATT